MKQVIFICLLSISLCLSAPPKETATDPAKHEDVPPPTEKIQALPTNSTPASLPAQATEITPAPQGTGPNTQPPHSNATNESNASPKDKDHATAVAPTTNVTEKANSTTEKAPAIPSSTVPSGKPVVTVPTSVPTSVSPTKPTPTEPEHKATVPPKIPEPIPVHARGFDGASFVGGIILTLGLLAIGFMGFKYYKNQTERNYHTL